ncbi:uncharacterized protein LOC134823112 [Bolinopsis microptera]|uniref:uncharacterized protein LOC134823112 n=1 Tax=Bolinopsis microptera TaxID=2820187 RepID=UPI00307A6985
MQQTRTVLKDLALLVIDEISMVSAEMMMSINLRLQEIFGADELFGGKTVIVFGDLLQLPPVHGKRPFQDLSGDDVHNLTGGLRIPSHLWGNFEYDELTINQRQKGEENEKWSSLLGRIRIGRQSQDDINILQERLIPVRQCELPNQHLDQIVDYYLNLQNQFPTTVCLLPKRNMMDSFNMTVMNKLFPKAIKVEADDDVDGRTNADKKRALDAVLKIDKLGDSRNTADLEKCLFLSEGVRIMLRKNIDTAKGLVNGAMGIVTKIVSFEELLVEFDGIDGVVTITRDTRKVKLFEDSYLHRRQFPISTGYALTIHKAQGMSLSHVFCDLGSMIFATGQIYVALSRCKTLDGLHLVNFDESRITVDRLAINEYVRLKSKPIIAAGITLKTDDQPESNKKGKKRQTKKKNERIWYETDAAKKAKATVNDTLKNDKKDQSKARKKKQPVKPKKTKPTTERNSSLTAANISTHINQIYVGIPAEYIPTTDIVSGAEMLLAYRRALVPGHRGNFRDSFISRTALELDPDPYNIRQVTDLWLTGSTITKYIAVIKDDLTTEIGGTTLYNMGPYCGGYRREGRRQAGLLGDYIKNTFGERPFTRLRQYMVLPFTIKAHMDKYGDPMMHDIIVMVGNPGAHWYTIIIDNRVRQVVHFDSLACSTARMKDRCSSHLRLVKDFRQYLREELQMEISQDLNTDDYSFVDGQSSIQRNSYDCGVFSLMNIEKYVIGRPLNHLIVQPLMKLFRLRILGKLYQQGVQQGLSH